MGKVISGKRAYFRLLKANIPATAMASQKETVKRGWAIASLEILKRSRRELGFVDFKSVNREETENKVRLNYSLNP